MSKINLSVVSYLNTKPFLYGLYANDLDQYLNIKLDVPSSCAAKLLRAEADLGLVPVAVIPHLKNPKLVSSYCIGTEGEVKTVVIYSQVPIQAVTHLYLDYQSITSAALTKYLLTSHWKVQPTLIQTQPGYETKIDGTHAGLVIGDRAIDLKEKFGYAYDLGSAWREHTGLPFVFAAWVAIRPLATDLLIAFDKALAYGVERVEQVAAMFQSYHPNFEVYKYYTQHINYQLDKGKQEGLDRFLRILRSNRF